MPAGPADPILDPAVVVRLLGVCCVLFGLVAVVGGLVASRQEHRMHDADVVDAADVPASRPVWVTGTARPVDDAGTFTSPVRKQPDCLLSVVTFDSPSVAPGDTLDWLRESVEYDAVPFLVEDDAGAVRVEPRGRHVPHGGVNFFGRHDVDTELEPSGDLESEDGESFTVLFDDLTGSTSDRPPTTGRADGSGRSPDHGDDDPAGFVVTDWNVMESVVRAGDEVSVFGYASVDDDLGGWGEDAVTVGVPPGRAGGFLLVADRPVPETLDRLRSKAEWLIAGGLVFALVGLFFAV